MDKNDDLPFSELWSKIDLAESYLVSSLYEEAASLSESVVKSCRGNNVAEYNEVHEILESAGMVFVQSLHGLERTANIMNQVVDLFSAIEKIPTQVLITGACLQISKNLYSGVSDLLESFLKKWTLCEDSFYVYENKNGIDNSTKITLSLREYVDVVEVYTVSLLGKSLRKWEPAIIWVENSSLPQDVKQVLLRKLVSLSSEAEIENKRSSPLSNGAHNIQEAVSLSKCNPQKKQSLVASLLHFNWFPMNLKLGNMQLQFTNSKVLLGCLLVLMYFMLRRRGNALIRFVKRKSTLAKKALLDFWQLAFSYQVNPLAAVQSLPVSARAPQ